MKSKINLIVFVFFVSTIFMSCKEQIFDEPEVTNISIVKKPENNLLNIPYTDSTTLSKFSNHRDILNYNLARKLALLELDATGFRKDLKWDGYQLSKMPVTIYGFDSKPKYYEFIVKDAENYEVGTVTVEARRKTSGVLFELRKDIRDYSSLFAKSGSGTKLIADWSGNLYMGVVGKAGDEVTTVVNTKNGEQVEGMKELSDEEVLEQMIAVLEDDEKGLEQMSDTLPNDEAKNKLNEIQKVSAVEQEDTLRANLEKEHAERDQYWAAMEEYADSIMLVSDSVIVEKSSKFLGRWFRRLFSSRNTSKYEMARYANNLGYRQNDDSWCGPFALGWIYHTKRGKDKYNNFLSYASTIGPAIGGPIVGLGSRLIGRPMYPREMWLATYFVTDWDIYVYPCYSVGKYHAYEYIRTKDEPVLIYQFPDHYVTAYGCYRQGNFWHSDFWFAIEDSGAHVSDKSKPYYQRARFSVLFIKAID